MKKFKISTLFEAIDGMSRPIRAMKRSVAGLSTAARRVSRSWGQVSAAGGALVGRLRGLAVVGLGAAAGLGALVRRTTLAGDRIVKTASKLGIGTDALQELRGAAQLAGIEARTFDMAYQRFTRRAAEAAAGTGEAKDALKALGIQLTDANGRMRPAEELLGEVADAMAKIKSPADRVRIAFKLFDSEGVSMVNMLQNGSKALQAARKDFRDTGAVISGSTLKASVTFNDAMTRLTAAIGGISAEIVGKLLPDLTSGAGGMLEFIKANRADIIEKAGAAIKSVGEIARGFATAVKAAAPVVQSIVDKLGGWENVGIAIAALIGVKFAASAVSFGVAIGGMVKSIGLLAAAFAANPVGLAVTAIAGGAALIIANWDKIGPFFESLWGGVTGAFKAGIAIIETRLAALASILDPVTAAWARVEAGVSGLWARIGAAWRSGFAGVIRWLADQVAKIEGLVPSFLRDRLGISGAASLRQFADSLTTVPAGPPAIGARGGIAAAGTPGAPGAAGKVAVDVRFQNAPPGTRTAVAADPAIDLTTETGMAFAGAGAL
jgi:hypothetical protein